MNSTTKTRSQAPTAAYASDAQRWAAVQVWGQEQVLLNQ